MEKDNQNHEIRVKLSLDQLTKIKKKSKDAGLRPSAFLRYLGLKSKVNVSFE